MLHGYSYDRRGFSWTVSPPQTALTGKVTILDLMDDGTLQRITHEYNAASEWNPQSEDPAPSLSEMQAKLLATTDMLASRVVMVDMTGDPMTDLCTLNLLYGAYGIDIGYLWYILRRSNEHSDNAKHYLRGRKIPPLFLDDMHFPWKRRDVLAIGGTSSLFLHGPRSPLPGKKFLGKQDT